MTSKPKTNRQRIFSALAVLAMLAALPASAFAQTPGTGNVLVGGRFLFSIRSVASGMTPEQRVAQVQQRLIQIGQSPIYASDIAVKPIGYDAAIYVKGRLLITVDSPMARAQQSTALGLANIWASRLQTMLPELTYATGTNTNVKTAASAILPPAAP